MNMSHKKLLKVLRRCPVSEHFGALESQLNRQTLSYDEAIKMVKTLVHNYHRGDAHVLHMIDEVAVQHEESAGAELSNSHRVQEIPIDNQIVEEGLYVEEEKDAVVPDLMQKGLVGRIKQA